MQRPDSETILIPVGSCARFSRAPSVCTEVIDVTQPSDDERSVSVVRERSRSPSFDVGEDAQRPLVVPDSLVTSFTQAMREHSERAAVENEVCSVDEFEMEREVSDDPRRWINIEKTWWFLTINYPDDFPCDPFEESLAIQQTKSWLDDLDRKKAYCLGFERGGHTTRFHAHAVVVFKATVRAACLRSFRVGSMHQYEVHPHLKFVNSSKVDRIKCVRYVCKERTKVYGHVENADYFISDYNGMLNRYLKGDFRNDGKKKTMRDIFEENIESIVARRFLEIDDQFFVLQYGDKLEKYAAMVERMNGTRRSVSHCRFIMVYGAAGSGKTSIAMDFARALYPELGEGAFYIKDTTKWWHNYRNEPVVIADEIRPDMTATLEAQYKIWGDRSEFTVEMKGSNKCICPEWFIVTSNYNPGQLWVDLKGERCEEYCNAMWRRAGYGNRYNAMLHEGEYVPMSVWEKMSDESKKEAYKKKLNDFIDKNSKVYVSPSNPDATA